MRWMLLKQLSRFHYQKAASDIIQETGDPAAATAEAIFERGNKTLAENLAMYANERPRKVPRIAGRLATGRAFSLSQVKRPRKTRRSKEPQLAYNHYEEELVPLFTMSAEELARGMPAKVRRTAHNAAKRLRRERRAY